MAATSAGRSGKPSAGGHSWFAWPGLSLASRAMRCAAPYRHELRRVQAELLRGPFDGLCLGGGVNLANPRLPGSDLINHPASRQSSAVAASSDGRLCRHGPQYWPGARQGATALNSHDEYCGQQPCEVTSSRALLSRVPARCRSVLLPIKQTGEGMKACLELTRHRSRS
jgi:hypothetical protein